jgi:hypothetical protein
VEREVKKRAWWFLVRQDWLQIPFQNTHLIYANQFNTPMPSNCYDDDERMTDGSEVIRQDDSILTNNSYTHQLNKGMVTVQAGYQITTSPAARYYRTRTDVLTDFSCGRHFEPPRSNAGSRTSFG